jgi:hypothetical protein
LLKVVKVREAIWKIGGKETIQNEMKEGGKDRFVEANSKKV